ncbi:MAG: hypothetical protein ACP5OZ_05355, partial [Candidatus Woesearchaeota archaeon]
LANVSAGAVDENFYAVYYGNPNATNASYFTIPNITSTIFYDAYTTSASLNNYSNPLGDFGITNQELYAHACNPSYLDTLDGLLNLSNWEFATITFQYREAGNLEADDCFYYRLYANENWMTDNILVFCDDVGATYLPFTIHLNKSYMKQDFKFRYYCTNFQGGTEYLYIDNLNVTVYSRGHPLVSSRVGNVEKFVYSISNDSIGSNGLWNWFWNTTGQEYGLYSIIALANKTEFIPAYNNTQFYISSNIPTINYVYATPDPVIYKNTINIYANITSSFDTIDKVIFEINNVNYTMNYLGGDIWTYAYNTSSTHGGLNNYTIYANDSSGRNAIPVQGNFTVNNQLSIVVKTDASNYELGQNVSVFVNVSVSGVGQDVGVVGDVVFG